MFNPDSCFSLAAGTITAYATTENCKTPNLIIPNTINGITVTAIGDEVFSSRQLLSVELPETLKTIGIDAFTVNQITSVTFPAGITSIGFGAFRSNQLTTVTIPTSVIEIKGYAFANNTSLGTITFQGRSSTTGMTLGSQWSGTGTIAFAP